MLKVRSEKRDQPAPQGRRRFTQEFKEEAVQMVLEGQLHRISREPMGTRTDGENRWGHSILLTWLAGHGYLASSCSVGVWTPSSLWRR